MLASVFGNLDWPIFVILCIFGVLGLFATLDGINNWLDKK